MIEGACNNYERLQCTSCGGELIKHGMYERQCKYCGAIYKFSDPVEGISFLPKLEIVKPGCRVFRGECAIPMEYYKFIDDEKEIERMVKRELLGQVMKYFEENFDDLFELESSENLSFEQPWDYAKRFRITGRVLENRSRYNGY